MSVPVDQVPEFRAKDKIMADLELVTTRLRANRQTLREHASGMRAHVFNDLTDKISQDAVLEDKLLGELFEAMVLEDSSRYHE